MLSQVNAAYTALLPIAACRKTLMEIFYDIDAHDDNYSHGNGQLMIWTMMEFMLIMTLMLKVMIKVMTMVN